MTRIRVGGRSPRFALPSAGGGLALLLEFLALTHRFFDPLLSLSGGTLPRCTLPSRQLGCVLFGQLLERLDLFLRRFQTLFQRTAAMKRALARLARTLMPS